ncbi:MAG: beta-ketoacyl synthase N-terminal-like domain-containing protein [Akkermansiaceae bacterium]
MHIAITGIGLNSGLGDGVPAHQRAIDAGQHQLRPLADLLGNDSPFASISASWIEDRSVMLSRKWAPASALSLHVARQAIEDAGLTDSDLTNTAVLVGSSRGNVAGWLSPWPGRRPFKLMAASNSMHGELASAVSIELGTHGPWQVISSGCAASLDALGMARMMMLAGMAKRAIVIGVELPLLPEVLQAYAHTGVLATHSGNDPYAPDASGFFPGEAAAALVLENTEEENSHPTLTGYWCNSDAASPIGMPEDGGSLARCLSQALGDLNELKDQPPIAAICPHASGTLLHGKAELAAMRSQLNTDQPLSLHPLKPFTGHTVGASGVLDCAILSQYMRQGSLPPNLPGLTDPAGGFTLDPANPVGKTILKIAVGMGGHNSIVSLRCPNSP